MLLLRTWLDTIYFYPNLAGKIPTISKLGLSKSTVMGAQPCRTKALYPSILPSSHMSRQNPILFIPWRLPLSLSIWNWEFTCWQFGIEGVESWKTKQKRSPLRSIAETGNVVSSLPYLAMILLRTRVQTNTKVHLIWTYSRVIYRFLWSFQGKSTRGDNHGILWEPSCYWPNVGAGKKLKHLRVCKEIWALRLDVVGAAILHGTCIRRVGQSVFCFQASPPKTFLGVEASVPKTQDQKKLRTSSERNGCVFLGVLVIDTSPPITKIIVLGSKNYSIVPRKWKHFDVSRIPIPKPHLSYRAVKAGGVVGISQVSLTEIWKWNLGSTFFPWQALISIVTAYYMFQSVLDRGE